VGALSDVLLFSGGGSSAKGVRGYSALGCASKEYKDLASNRSMDNIC
jgi:hypothetical protein